jgi:membrane protein
MIIRGYNVVPLLKQTFKEIGEDRVPSLAAETAYYFFFSLFPLLLFLTPLLGVIGNGRELMDALLGRLATALPPDALSLLRKTLTEIVTANGNAGIMSVGVLLAGYSGSGIFGALMGALNTAYDATETRPWWKQQLLRLACLLVSGLVVIAVTLVFLDGERLSQFVGDRLHLGFGAVAVLTAAQFVVATLLVMSLCACLFKLLPNVRQRWAHVIVASTATTVLWLIAMVLFRVYVQHFGSYNKTYGTVGAVIVLLSWMYYTMLVLLAGGELASELHRGSGAVDPIKGEIYLGRIVSGEGPGTPSMGKVKQAQ